MFRFLSIISAVSTGSWWTDLRQGTVDLAENIIKLLPESPIVSGLEAAETFSFSQWLPFVNWFVPFGTILQITGVWLTAIALYYVYQIVLRWVKVIE